MTPGYQRKAWVNQVHGFGPSVIGDSVPPSSSSFTGDPGHGGHDAVETFEQLQGRVAGNLGRVVEAFDLRRAVE